jgi:excisionase family DNA binding protein
VANTVVEQEITVAEAARRLGVTLAHVYSLLWAGRLQGRKINRQWLVSGDAIETRRNKRGGE